MDKNTKNIKKLIPIVAAVAGILIMLFSSDLSTGRSEGKAPENQSDIDAYTDKLEEKVRQLCEAVNGVSHVSVAITLEGGFEYEYAKNTEYGKNSYGDERREEYLVIGSGSNEKCVILRQKLPGIAGVGIVCKGGGNADVREELTMLVSSVLNIGTNKIYITSSDK